MSQKLLYIEKKKLVKITKKYKFYDCFRFQMGYIVYKK